MRSGRLDFLVTFNRREPIPGKPHDRANMFTPYLSDEPAEYRRLSGADTLEGGRLSDVEQGTLIVRDSPETRQITAADRVTIEGRDFAIKTVPIPARRLRRIEIAVSSELGS